MSPLAEAIYRILADRAILRQSLMTYSELVKALPPLSPPYDGVTRNDPRLFEALGDVGAACRDVGLPTLTALVVRSTDRAPGDGYYKMFHPEAGNDPSRRREAWERELEQVRSAQYPAALQQEIHFGQPEPPRDDRHGPRQLGLLRFADDAQKPGTVFVGLVTCSSCTQSFEVQVQKNPSAMTEKQPTFLILPARGGSGKEPSGHLFIGTRLTSPVLYYGSLKHCGHEQRISIFFNRALRDRSDAHLVILPSTSSAANS